MSDNVVTSYTSKQAQQIAGSPRSSLLGPDRSGAASVNLRWERSRRAYSYGDLLRLRVIKDLLDNGVGLPQIRDVFTNHKNILGEDLAGGRLVISGNEVLFMTGPDELVALLQRPGQQALALIMLEVEGIKAQLNGAIVSELGRRRDSSAEMEVVEEPEAGEAGAGYGT